VVECVNTKYICTVCGNEYERVDLRGEFEGVRAIILFFPVTVPESDDSCDKRHVCARCQYKMLKGLLLQAEKNLPSANSDGRS
jgi:DNA-directed RNA polymerase subunit RPC12/RpoP